MFTIAAIPNLVALALALVAMVLLAALATKLGGQMGLVLRLVAAGVFLSVFVHAGLELAEVAGLVTSEWLMSAMGVVISLGSVTFCAAGIVGLRAIR